MLKRHIYQLLLFFSLLLPAALPADSAKQPIKLGAIVSLTGPAAEQGKNWLTGAELAAKNFEQEGVKVDLIVEDDQTNPASVATAFQKLVTIDHVSAVLGGTWDFLMETAAPLAKKYQITFITPTNPVEILSESTKENPYFFTNGLSMRATEVVVEGILDRLQVKSIVIMVPAVPYGYEHARIVQKEAEQRGIKVLLNTSYEFSGQRDVLRKFVMQVTDLKPEAVFCLTDYVALSQIAKDLQGRRLAPWLITTQHLDEAIKLSQDNSLWAKAVGIYPKIENPEFTVHFESRYGFRPKVYAAEGYDAVTFLVRAKLAGVDLQKTAFMTTGVTGRLKSTPISREIAGLQARAVKVTESGELVDF